MLPMKHEFQLQHMTTSIEKSHFVGAMNKCFRTANKMTRIACVQQMQYM